MLLECVCLCRWDIRHTSDWRDHAWIRNYIYYHGWDEIAFPFSNFIGRTIDTWEWISDSIPQFLGYMITYPCWIGKYVGKRGLGYVNVTSYIGTDFFINTEMVQMLDMIPVLVEDSHTFLLRCQHHYGSNSNSNSNSNSKKFIATNTLIYKTITVDNMETTPLRLITWRQDISSHGIWAMPHGIIQFGYREGCILKFYTFIVYMEFCDSTRSRIFWKLYEYTETRRGTLYAI